MYMPTTTKKKPSKKNAAGSKRASAAEGYSNDPYFVKKAEESKAFLEKHGFPEELLPKK
jgi:hypothetical protein